MAGKNLLIAAALLVLAACSENPISPESTIVAANSKKGGGNPTPPPPPPLPPPPPSLVCGHPISGAACRGDERRDAPPDRRNGKKTLQNQEGKYYFPFRDTPGTHNYCARGVGRAGRILYGFFLSKAGQAG